MSVIAIGLPLPDHYNQTQVVDAERWLDYNGLAHAAVDWRNQHKLTPAKDDRKKIGLLCIDEQVTFCHPLGELAVVGAVEDAQRLVEFVYREMGILSAINCTLDTHRAYAVFHPAFLVDENGRSPDPFTIVPHKAILDGDWAASPFMASALGVNLMAANRQLLDYTEKLEKSGRYQLMIWPYHAMLGGKGHNLVSGLEEACFFHAIARGAQTHYEVKGTNVWTENYSVLGPEVTQLSDGKGVPRNAAFIQQLLEYDYLIIAGQAKSHCVAWTIEDLLGEILAQDRSLAEKVYLLEDCTSPVVTPVADFTAEGEAAFQRFADAGMHLVKSTDPISTWPGVEL